MTSYGKCRLKVLMVLVACAGNIATGSTFLRHRVLPVGANSREQEIALETIVEEDRQKTALHELKSLKGAIKDFNKHVSKDIKRFDKLVKNYESTPAEFDQMFADVFTQRKQEVETLWQRRSAMLAHIEPDEWQAIISSARAKMEAKKK